MPFYRGSYLQIIKKAILFYPEQPLISPLFETGSGTQNFIAEINFATIYFSFFLR